MSMLIFLQIDKVVMIEMSAACLQNAVVAFSGCLSLSMTVTMPNSCQNAIDTIRCV